MWEEWVMLVPSQMVRRALQTPPPVLCVLPVPPVLHVSHVLPVPPVLPQMVRGALQTPLQVAGGEGTESQMSAFGCLHCLHCLHCLYCLYCFCHGASQQWWLKWRSQGIEGDMVKERHQAPGGQKWQHQPK